MAFTLYGPNGQKLAFAGGNARSKQLTSQGWGLRPGSYRPGQPKVNPNPVITDPNLPPQPSESDQMRALIEQLTPKPVDTGALSGRFASLFDPTYNQNATDINATTDLAMGRAKEDYATGTARLVRSRALTQGQTAEQQAAGGAGGQLAAEQLAQVLQPYDQQSQDMATQSGRFNADTEEERRRKLLANRQARAAALAGYQSDPNNLYEFSY